MARSRQVISIVLLLLLTTQSPLFAASKSVNPKAAGRNSSSIPNTILNGSGAPKSSLGIDGDFYIDTKNLLMYGPKASGKWGIGISLKGVDGVAGKDGRTITNASTLAGPQGEKGEKGDKGEQGLKGETGASGPAGPAGPTGPSGSNGAPGAQGPSGSNGSNGAPGAAGATGAQGPKGETGTAGAKGDQGISLVQYANLEVKTLSGIVGTTQSYSSLGNFAKDGFYVVHLMVWAYNTEPQPTYYEFTFAPTVSDAAILKESAWISGSNEVRRDTSALNETNFSVTLYIDTHGQAGVSTFGFSLKLGVAVSAGQVLTIKGNYEVIQVGDLKPIAA